MLLGHGRGFEAAGTPHSSTHAGPWETQHRSDGKLSFKKRDLKCLWGSMYLNTSVPLLLVVLSDTSKVYTVFQGPGFYS